MRFCLVHTFKKKISNLQDASELDKRSQPIVVAMLLAFLRLRLVKRVVPVSRPSFAPGETSEHSVPKEEWAWWWGSEKVVGGKKNFRALRSS